MGFLSALARISLDMTVVTLIIIYLPGKINNIQDSLDR